MRYKLIALSCFGFGIAATSAAQPGAPPDAAIGTRVNWQDAHFVENRGQWSDDTVHFALRADRLDVAFRESSLALRPVLANSSDQTALVLSFPGSHATRPTGANHQQARFNYFVRGDGRGTAVNVPSFANVVYENLYDGVDLHIGHNNHGILKYEFRVAPGAQWSCIRLAYEGITDLCTGSDGSLRIESAFGTLLEKAPVVWQEIDGVRRPIAARFEMIDNRTCSIVLLEAPDPAHPIVIDPDVQWMTYLGGWSNYDQAFDTAIDPAGSTITTGWTYSLDFEGRNNAHHGDSDVFVAKVDAAGSLQWMTYLGGSTADGGYGVDVDTLGNSFITGFTDSDDFEGQLNAHHGKLDAFIANLDPAGSLLSMSYLGGALDDIGNDIIIEGTENAFVTGETFSVDFEGRTNAHHGGDSDAFVAWISFKETLEWMTYIGGSGADQGHGIALDQRGNSLVSGHTTSLDFETRLNTHHGGECDAFVAAVDVGGASAWMTYLGGSAEEYAYAIAVDAGDNALVTGYTDSLDFAGRGNAYHGGMSDAFVARISSLSAVPWVTYLGGSGDEYAHDIAIDTRDCALVTGFTSSTDFDGATNAYHGGWFDALAAKLGPTGELRWMTYLGGAKSDCGNSIVLDGAGGAIIAGHTESTDFEGRINSFHDFWDAFTLRLDLEAAAVLDVVATCPTGGPAVISWAEATPDGNVALLFALDEGAFVIPINRPCAGTPLGLGGSRLQIAWQGRSNAGGEGIKRTTLGSGSCGGYLQLLDLTDCTTSNVAQLE